jgi:Tfp pilus assembly protein PilX
MLHCSSPRRARGVSLVEALVAMIVMSLGTIAVLGVQATLRLNSDISKQRAEAVRIGQAAMETWRGYVALNGDDPGSQYFDEIADDEQEVAGLNATYTVTLDVPAETDDPPAKAVVVEVRWDDRTGQTQTVRLTSNIFGSDPALAGTLGIVASTSALVNPGGRHPAIPPEAKPLPEDGGKSKFVPPGAADGVAWVFDNNTGFIVQACTDVSNCVDTSARLLTGFLNFSYSDTPNSELPEGTRLSDIGVVVDQTLPESEAGTVACYQDFTALNYVPYYCAVPVSTQPFWSGRSLVVGPGIATASSLAYYKVCRYTPYTDRHRTVPTEMRNEEHPQYYVDVGTALVNQNFLIIRAETSAGDAIGCPLDGGTSPVDGRTFRHQPST